MRNNAIMYKILPPATPERIIRYGVALFLFALFRNISQYISKYFEISFEIFRNNFDFEIFRNILKYFEIIEIFCVDRNTFERFQHAISFERFRIFILLMSITNLFMITHSKNYNHS